MKPMPLALVAQALGSTLCTELDITEVCTDTREIVPGCLFVALEGERFDGHDFAGQALALGAAAVLVHKDMDTSKERTIRVEDTRNALIAIGGLYREMFTVRMVGITGSVGKTTTKEMAAAVLARRYRTLKTEANLNNEIGTAKTLFRLEEGTQAGVVEMGMTGFGEIEALSRAVKPDVGIITSIGVSHMEALGSRQNILKAKMEITAGMADGKTLLLCGDNDLLQTVTCPRLNVMLYGIENQACQILAKNMVDNSSQTDFTILYNGKSYAAAIPAIGRHNVQNALAAFGAGVALGLAPEEAALGLADFAPSGMRQKMVEHRGAKVVEDCYNASPDSMRAALSTLASTPCTGRKIAVLGDMLELGSISEEAHLEVGRYAARQGIDILCAYGERAKAYCEGAKALPNVRHFTDKETLGIFLAHTVKPGDIVWFKASRGVKLEDAIQRYYADSPGDKDQKSGETAKGQGV